MFLFCLNRRPRKASIEEKVFTCSKCVLEFKQRAEWEKHLKWHDRLIMDSISYACNQCGMQYRQLSSLKNHIISLHVATAISLQSSRGQNGSYGDSSCQKSNEEIGQKNGEQQGNAETVQQHEDSDDEMDQWSDAESERMFEEDDQSVIEDGNQKCWEDVTKVCPPDNDDGHVKGNCQDPREGQEPNVKTTVTDLKAKTDPQVTQAPCKPDSDLQQIRRSSRMSSDAYIHKILHGDDPQRRYNRGRQMNREVIVQDGQRKRQHEGHDVEGNVGKRGRRSDVVSGGFGQPSDQQNCPVVEDVRQGGELESRPATLKVAHTSRMRRYLKFG